MIPPQFYTIGVYGLSYEQFFDKLTTNNIDTFIDIRKRRAVRGSKFSFVNSKRLQERLAQLSIRYLHILELAPTNEIRKLQTQADELAGIKKRERSQLGDTFINEYKRQILSHYDLHKLLDTLSKNNSKKAILFCVEREPQACHRSLVTEQLEKEFGTKSIHL